MADSCLVRVKQPPPELHQSIQAFDFADAAPGADTAEEQYFCRIDIADAGRG